MAGLVPAIHVLLRRQDVDARHKAGHDGAWSDGLAPSTRRSSYSSPSPHGELLTGVADPYAW